MQSNSMYILFYFVSKLCNLVACTFFYFVSKVCNLVACTFFCFVSKLCNLVACTFFKTLFLNYGSHRTEMF